MLPLRIGLTVDGWTLGIQMNIRPSALFCVANETVDDVEDGNVEGGVLWC